MPRGTRLELGRTAVVELTGLRNPCVQIERFAAGLLSAVIDRAPDGAVIRKSGVMSIVIAGGMVAPGDRIVVRRPPASHEPLDVV